jgi:hypothetical protein
MREPRRMKMADYAKERGGCDMELWWEERTLPEKVVLGIGFGILGIGLLAVFGWVVMLLWNWLMPEIFGLKTVSYWQAWGLLILSYILFKGIDLGSDQSSRRTEKRRKRELRRYMQEGEGHAQEGSLDEGSGGSDERSQSS